MGVKMGPPPKNVTGLRTGTMLLLRSKEILGESLL